MHRFIEQWFGWYLLGFAVILFPFYYWIHKRVELGNWVVLFFLPSVIITISPFFLYSWIISSVWTYFVPMPNTEGDGGVLYVVVETINWITLVIALYFSKGSKVKMD
jgi:hypothetical protein